MSSMWWATPLSKSSTVNHIVQVALDALVCPLKLGASRLGIAIRTCHWSQALVVDEWCEPFELFELQLLIDEGRHVNVETVTRDEAIPGLIVFRLSVKQSANSLHDVVGGQCFSQKRTEKFILTFALIAAPVILQPPLLQVCVATLRGKRRAVLEHERGQSGEAAGAGDTQHLQRGLGNLIPERVNERWVTRPCPRQDRGSDRNNAKRPDDTPDLD